MSSSQLTDERIIVTHLRIAGVPVDCQQREHQASRDGSLGPFWEQGRRRQQSGPWRDDSDGVCQLPSR